MASEHRSANPSRESARDALRSIGRDRGRLADRITTPRWYHPTVAALTTAAGIAPALPEPWALTVPAVFVILIGTLPALTRRSGIAMSVRPTGRATRILLALQVATLMVFMVASAAVRLFDLGWWWIAPIALLVFTLILFLGRRYDHAQHAELSAHETPL